MEKNKDGVETELNVKLTREVIEHRRRFKELFNMRYREIIVNMRNYSGLPVSINKYKLEQALRQGYEVIIGKNTLGVTTILGLNQNKFSVSDPINFIPSPPLDMSSIQWIVPEYLRPSEMKEITELDDAVTGNFVILRNKPVTYVNDFELIDFYSSELCEVIASRYSLIIQSKLGTVIQSEVGDETANQVISALYNGSPFLKLTELFDPKLQVLEMGNPNNSAQLKQNEETYNTILKELNNMLAIDSAGVNKLSGVSASEVSSNDDFVGSNANLYIDGIQYPFDLYNKRFGTNYQVFFQNQPATNLNPLIEKQMEDKK